jgi:predicted nucleic-acid-binding protein
MTAYLDTNVLVRHLTGDPEDMAQRATSYLRESDVLMLCDLVVAEVVYVLESYYEVPRARVAELVRSILAYESMHIVDSPLLLRALEVYEVHRIDFAESYLVACAEASGATDIASFDRSLDRVTTIQRVEP